MKYLLFILSLACSLYWSNLEASETLKAKEIRLTLTDNTKTRCGIHEGCAVIGENTCEIIAPKPKDYLDHWRLEILGHELWHCFNGKNH